jgi:hypothetical protein
MAKIAIAVRDMMGAKASDILGKARRAWSQSWQKVRWLKIVRRY